MLRLSPETQALADLRDGDDLILEPRADGVLVRTDSLRRVYVELTGRCNLACAMCPRAAWGGSAQDMAAPCFDALLAGLPAVSAGAITLVFGGFGEPTLHPGVLDAIAAARAAGHRTELITNGTLLTSAFAAQLLDAGVGQVTVSIDGGDDPSYAAMRGVLPASALAGASALRDARRTTRARVRLGLACVVTTRTAPSLPALLDTAARLDADFVHLSGMVPHTAQMAAESVNSRAAQLSGLDPRRSRPRVLMGRLDYGPETRALVDALLGDLPVIPPHAFDQGTWRDRCRFVHEGVCAVRWDGSVAPCLSLLYTHGEFIGGREKVVRACTFGHVQDQPLRAIWRDEAYRRFRARLRAFDVSPCLSCGGCGISDTNDSDCFGTAFPACGECLWAQGIVLCP